MRTQGESPSFVLLGWESCSPRQTLLAEVAALVLCREQLMNLVLAPQLLDMLARLRGKCLQLYHYVWVNQAVTQHQLALPQRALENC